MRIKRIVNESDEGRIKIEYLENKKSVYIELDEQGCRFLIEELNEFLENPKDYFMDYDLGTGYDCGILTKNSLGLMIGPRYDK